MDLCHWTCLYMEDSSVCKWMIHAEGIQKWIFLKKMARLLLRSCELIKVSPLCTIIATDVPERMTIKAPQTNQNHLQYDSNFTLLD